MKKWSYKEVTDNAEKLIKQYMANSVSRTSDDSFEKWMWRNKASGVYFSWYQLTCGWQNPGDNERLEKLTNIESYQEK